MSALCARADVMIPGLLPIEYCAVVTNTQDYPDYVFIEHRLGRYRAHIIASPTYCIGAGGHRKARYSILAVPKEKLNVLLDFNYQYATLTDGHIEDDINQTGDRFWEYVRAVKEQQYLAQEDGAEQDVALLSEAVLSGFALEIARRKGEDVIVVREYVQISYLASQWDTRTKIVAKHNIVKLPGPTFRTEIKLSSRHDKRKVALLTGVPLSAFILLLLLIHKTNKGKQA